MVFIRLQNRQDDVDTRGKDVDITDVADSRWYIASKRKFCIIDLNCHDWYGEGEERNVQQGCSQDPDWHVRRPLFVTMQLSIVGHLS